MQSLIRTIALMGIIALGEALVILVGEIDLSVGAIMITSIMVSIKIINWIGIIMGIQMIERGCYFIKGSVPLIILSLCVGGIFGLINGIGVTKGKINSFIMTLGIQFIGRGLNYVLSEGHSIYFLYLKKYLFLGNRNLFEIPISGILFIILSLFFIIIMKYTLLGSRIYAIGGNEEAVRYSGIKTHNIKIFVCVISGICASLCGLILTSRIGAVDPGQGIGYELTAIAVVVVGNIKLEGGKGSILGILRSVVFLALLANLLDLQGGSVWIQNTIRGILIIFILILSKSNYLYRLKKSEV